MSQYFLKPYKSLGGNIKFKVSLSNYATKKDLKHARGADTYELTAKPDLANLKAKIDKTDVNKLNIVPVALIKLTNAVNNVVVKKTLYDKLVEKVNKIDTSGFVLKTK